MLKYGILFGLVQVIITLVIYILGVEYLVSWWIGILLLLLMLGYMIFSAYMWRKSNTEEPVKFMDVFSVTFLVYGVFTLINVLFSIVFYNVIQPDLPGFIEEQAIFKAQSMMERYGVPESQIEESIEKMAGMAANYKPIPQLKSYFFGLFFGAIVAAILGLIFKSKPQQPFTDAG